MRKIKFQFAAITMAILVCTSIVHANAIGGQREDGRRISAHSTQPYQPILFRGGEVATVVVIGDGTTDLDLYVYDEYGNLVAMDNDYSDHCVATWFPSRTGWFTVKIVNRGSVYNDYSMATN